MRLTVFPNRPKTQNAPRGFTLMELMIGMLLLAIGIMATMSMQFIALAGFGVSRDNTNAAEVARRVEQVLKMEAMQWSQSQGLGNIQPVVGTNSPFIDGSLLTQADQSNWLSLFETPVDQRLLHNGSQRFCAFLRGAPMANEPNVFQAQIAVVFPQPKGTIPGADANDPHGKCGDVATVNLDPTDSSTLELTGLRAAYFGVHVSPRLP